MGMMPLLLCNRLSQFMLMLLTTITVAMGTKVEVLADEYCQSDMFEPACGSDEVIVMQTAQYGRIQLGKCLTENFGFMDCKSDVISVLDRKCSGKRQCSVKVEDSVFPAVPACHKDLKSYLAASYSCIRVMVPPATCAYEKGAVIEATNDGFISSHMTKLSHCGSTTAPITVQSRPGQTLSLVLMDFSSNSTASRMRPGPSSEICRVVATISDPTAQQSSTVCSGQGRIVPVYSSATNKLEIRFMGRDDEGPEFLLKYSVHGCPTLTAPSGGWVRQSNMDAELGCDTPEGVSWRMRCEGTTWVGQVSNCTQDLEDGIFGRVVQSVQALPFDVSVMLVAGIAVIVGCIILTAGIFCIKYRMKRTNQRTPSTSRDLPPPPPPIPQMETGSLKTGAHPTHAPPNGYPGDQMSRENEYASMRLLPPGQEYIHGQDPQNVMAHGGAGTHDRRRHCQSPEHIYESPDLDRRDLTGHDTLGRDPAGHDPRSSVPNTMVAAPHYFDIDPSIGLPANGAVPFDYCTCAPVTSPTTGYPHGPSDNSDQNNIGLHSV